MFKESFVALVTPMQANGEIDTKAVQALVEWHIAEKTAGLVVVGTTGESATLSFDEQLALIKLVKEVANGRLPIVAGTGTNDTKTTIAKSQAVAKLGIEGLLVVTPYYNKPTQGGLLLHYQACARAVSLPIILYNVPSRTGCDLLPDTVAQLSKMYNIVAIKEATGDMQRLQTLKAVCPDAFVYLSGDDATTLDFIEQGGHGVISVTANVAPGLMQNLCQAALKGDRQHARQINEQLMPLHKALFVEPNPIPVKWALAQMGKIPAGIRLPLTPLAKDNQAVVQAALNALK